jgi:[calcium/calmodulin-dependent protein kinase] kinase
MIAELLRGVDGDGNKVINEYATVATLGQGTFGKVKLCIDTSKDMPVAIKILNRTALMRKACFQLVRQEIEIMRRIRHVNLVKLMSVIDDEDAEKLYMVMEYMPGGTLCKTPASNNLIPALHTFKPHEIHRRFLDVLHGLNYLHCSNVVHMDIKPDNILLDASGRCKLADFGVSTVLEANFTADEDILRSVRGTPLFFAPEMLMSDTFHGKATDVWALGVTMYIAVYGSIPFRGVDLADIHEGVKHRNVMCAETATIQNVPVPPELRDVLYRMLCKDPSLRITVPSLLGHPFFTHRVPLEWSVRLWKERKLEKELPDMEAVCERARRIHLRDATDRGGTRYITADTLLRCAGDQSIINPNHEGSPHDGVAPAPKSRKSRRVGSRELPKSISPQYLASS